MDSGVSMLPQFKNNYHTIKLWYGHIRIEPQLAGVSCHRQPALHQWASGLEMPCKQEGKKRT
ncbi:hypothetical protein E2C01_080400 [Portunus trituberculatus]|uniref:Uncharacterized protein n=1 Tax=Portunus trituberculatus TaxID=210409 RepID=A0A5B7IU12_PORTR|nr:hypothetical protein [Portunus trituberculatus]